MDALRTPRPLGQNNGHRKRGRPRQIREIAPDPPQRSRENTAEVEALVGVEALRALPHHPHLKVLYDLGQWWVKDGRRQWAVEDADPGPFKFVDV